MELHCLFLLQPLQIQFDQVKLGQLRALQEGLHPLEMLHDDQSPASPYLC